MSDGIFVVPNTPKLSYPEEGNALCFQLEEKSFWFRHRNQCILEAVRQFPSPDPLLDVGGGNGFTSRALQEAGYDVILVEPGPAGAQNARARGVSMVICSTLQDLDLPDGQIGAIGMFDVLEHIKDDLEILRYAHAKLVRNGRLYLTVPAGSLL